jgi:hypothetical protein
MSAVRSRGWVALVGAALAVLPFGRADAQSAQVRGGFVGFGTGDEVNCPTGMGVAGGVDVRTRGRIFAGLGADLYVATPQVCTSMSRLVPFRAGYADEFAGVTLLFAPRLSARVGAHADLGTTRVEPSFVAGLIHAPELWRDGARRVLPYAGGALAVQPVGWRFGLVLEHGYQRVPVAYRVREQDRWRTIHEYGRWKPLFSAGVAVIR